MRNRFISGKIALFFPFQPTDEQAAAIRQVADFLLSEDPRSVLLLKGYAGTGKTSLIGATVRALNELQQKNILMAPTGRAAKVFSRYAGQNAFTIHRKIYRKKAFSNELEGFSLAGNLHGDTLFFVDEASMISNDTAGNRAFGDSGLLDDLIRYVYSGERCRLILTGDAAQLPPVSQLESPALNAGYLRGYSLQVHEIQLTRVARQSEDSGILFNATLIRKCLQERRLGDYPALRLAGFADVKKVGGEELIETISSAYDRDGVDETMIVCRSNKRANLYNNGVRSRILYREEEISRGDRLMVVKNNYFRTEELKDTDFIANGEIVEVLRVRHAYEMYGFGFCDVRVRFQDDDREAELRILTDTLQSEAPSLSKEMGDKLFYGVLESYTGEKTRAGKLKKVKVDPHYNAVQVKYAYAVTCHKAQGGQWRNVFLDVGYVTHEMLGEDFYRWLYTAFTRATQQLYLVNLPGEFEEK
ncbi:MAG: AAA family ATPase [Tannerella sp.]|jgi:exodeoxyribonuclease-5|nr:AAA family ATPase [Tannerella sp.]